VQAWYLSVVDPIQTLGETEVAYFINGPVPYRLTSAHKDVLKGETRRERGVCVRERRVRCAQRHGR